MGSLKPYIHEHTIRVRFFKDESYSAKFIGRDEYKVKLDYIGMKDSNTAENLITISDLVIPPQAEVIISFGVRKSMMQFE